jgi:hypothetical protein
MILSGTVVNGAVIPDPGTTLPEGARVQLEIVEDLPPEHPMAPYNPDVELALIRKSVLAHANGEPGIPLRQAFEDLTRKHGLRPMDAE